VRCCRCGVRVAKASKDAYGTVIRLSTVEKLEGSEELASTARASIQKESCRGERLCPECVRHGRMNKQGTGRFIERAEHALSTAVLRRCVRARHAESGAATVEECTRGVTVEFAAIVSLQRKDRQVEMCVCKRIEFLDGSECIRFEAEGKCPREVAVVIK
jgi:hypothetical protein